MWENDDNVSRVAAQTISELINPKLSRLQQSSSDICGKGDLSTVYLL